MARSRLIIPIILASIVGTSTGFVVVGFIKAIEFSQYFFFVTVKGSLSGLGPFAVILIPALGAMLVGPIILFMAPEAKGHGVPEVMKAIALRGGRIRAVVVLAKALASAISIGSGASVGREGPIVQVGSAIGSWTAQIFRLNEARIRNLLACGAAAGISGVFNAPIAGVMFSMEVILRDFSANALSTVVVASVAASIISRIFLGESPAFIAPIYSLWSPSEIFLYLLVGILSALMALTFIDVLDRTETLFEKWKFPNLLKPVVGGLLIGTIGLYFPQVFGSGLNTIEKALNGSLSLQLMLILIIVKILATSLSLGSGSSGGVFAPALFIGAVLGGACGKLFQRYMPFAVAPPGAYALVGMASVFAGAAHAPVTAILIVFEMTGDYRMILPIMVAVVSATSIAQLLRRESIYTVKLKRMGIEVRNVDELKLLSTMRARDAMTSEFMSVSRKLPADQLITLMSANREKVFFEVNDAGDVTGLIKSEDVQEILFVQNLSGVLTADVSTPIPETIHPDDFLNEASRMMSAYNLRYMPVVSSKEEKTIVGVIRAQDIFRAYTDQTMRETDTLSRLQHEETEAAGVTHLALTIPSKSTLVGKPLRELHLPAGVVFASIERRGGGVIPDGSTVIHARDKIWAGVITKNVAEFRSWLEANGLTRFSISS